MKLSGLIYTFPKEFKLFITTFVVVLSIGFFTGLLFVGETSGAKPNGIEEQYLGNEANQNAKIMKFKKGQYEMLAIVHTHILSMSFIFFLLGMILLTTQINRTLKIFLLVEPFISVIVTFGGIYLLWMGYQWMKYIVMFSGTLMTISFAMSAMIILVQLTRKVQ